MRACLSLLIPQSVTAQKYFSNTDFPSWRKGTVLNVFITYLFIFKEPRYTRASPTQTCYCRTQTCFQTIGFQQITPSLFPCQGGPLYPALCLMAGEQQGATSPRERGGSRGRAPRGAHSPGGRPGHRGGGGSAPGYAEMKQNEINKKIK